MQYDLDHILFQVLNENETRKAKTPNGSVSKII